MQLQGEKIVLRSVLPADADLLYKWENDKANWQISGTKKAFTKKQIKEFIAGQKDIYLDKQLRLMICRGNSPLSRGIKGDVAVGCIDLFAFDQPNLNSGIGILIDKKYRKKGYASEALALLIIYSFEVLNLHNLYCNISDENTASLKLFQKHNFRITEKKKNVSFLELTNK